MKNYSETERLTHVEKWKNGTLSKAAYAKSAGIIPTTFYKWAQQAEIKKQRFVEIDRMNIPKNIQDMVIEKDDVIIRLPLSTGIKELQTLLRGKRNNKCLLV